MHLVNYVLQNNLLKFKHNYSALEKGWELCNLIVYGYETLSIKFDEIMNGLATCIFAGQCYQVTWT